MGSVPLRTLEARLTRLEARVAAIPDPHEQKEEERIWHLYLNVWDRGGTLEDVPEKDRDPRIWEIDSSCALTFLEMVWEGLLDGRDELLAARVDFTRPEGVDEDALSLGGPTLPPTVA